MASESVESERVSTTVSESLDEWIAAQVENAGVDREQLLRQLLVAYREATEQGDATVEAIVEAETTRLAERQDELESAYTEDLDDVRDRVIQVKQEIDEKAPADHDHPDLREQATTVAAQTESLEATVEDLRSRLEGGFENYEEILEYLTETTDDLESKVDTLADAVVDVRARMETEAERQAVRDAVAELAAEANRRGVRTGTCEECERSVDIALLSAPECPHCASTFSGIEEAEGLSGLFGQSTLLVGDRPALDGDIADVPESDASERDVTDEVAELLAPEGR